MTIPPLRTEQEILDRAYQLRAEGYDKIPWHQLLGHDWLDNPQLRDNVRALKRDGRLVSIEGHAGFLRLR